MRLQPARSSLIEQIPFPLCCWRYRPGKPYGLHLLQFSVLQCTPEPCWPADLRRLLHTPSPLHRLDHHTSAGACAAQWDTLTLQGVYCPGAYSVHYAAVSVSSRVDGADRSSYVESIDFVSISVALCASPSPPTRLTRSKTALSPSVRSLSPRRSDLADALTREQLKGHSPLAKFLTIKVRITAGATAEPRS